MYVQYVWVWVYECVCKQKYKLGRASYSIYSVYVYSIYIQYIYTSYIETVIYYIYTHIHTHIHGHWGLVLHIYNRLRHVAWGLSMKASNRIILYQIWMYACMECMYTYVCMYSSMMFMISWYMGDPWSMIYDGMTAWRAGRRPSHRRIPSSHHGRMPACHARGRRWGTRDEVMRGEGSDEPTRLYMLTICALCDANSPSIHPSIQLTDRIHSKRASLGLSPREDPTSSCMIDKNI
jgi:hypothetical protein